MSYKIIDGIQGEIWTLLRGSCEGSSEERNYVLFHDKKTDEDGPYCYGRLHRFKDTPFVHCTCCDKRWDIPYENLKMLLKMRDFRE